jgi:tetratricopeptide (TPR) repeat protein
MAHHFLGVAYHALGDYRRAMGVLRSNVESLTGDLIRESFGLLGHPAVNSRSWLVRCLAELGAFLEGGAYGEEAIQIAEAVDHPHSLILAYLGVGFLSLRQRDLSRAIPVLERCLNLCRVWNGLVWFPETAAALGCAYAFAGRVAEALPLLEQAEQRGAAMGTTGGQSLRVGYVSEAYLLAGRMQEAVQLAGRALGLARAHKERGHEAWALRLLGEIAAHQAPRRSSRLNITTGRPSPWPRNSACVRSWPTATSVWARCLPRQASRSRPVLRCPLPSRCIAPWR